MPATPRQGGDGARAGPPTGAPRPGAGAAERPGPLPRRPRRALALLTAPLRWLAWALAITVPLAAMGLGLIYVKLLFGSIPLHFLVDPIRSALIAEMGGVDVAIGDAELHRGAAGGFELRLRDVDLAAWRGDTAVRASEAVVELDFAALRSGRIAAERIVLVAPRLVFLRELARLQGFAPTQPFAAAEGAAIAANANADIGALAPDGAVPRLALARVIADMAVQLRRKDEAASRLRAVGVRDATLGIGDHGRRAVWKIAEMEIGVAHRNKASLITGSGRISAGGAPFDVSFTADVSQQTRTLKVSTVVAGLSPPALAANLPHLGILAAVDAPVGIKGDVELSDDGHIVAGRFDVALGRGSILPQTLGGFAIGIDGGQLALRYDGSRQRLELEPSTVELDGSRVRLKGELGPVPVAGTAVLGWQLDLAAIDGMIAEAPGRPATRIDELAVRARLWPASGASELSSFVFRAGGVRLDARGTMAGGEAGGARLDGRIGQMDADTIKAYWPTGIWPELRAALAERLVKGRLKEGTFRIARGADDAASQVAISLEAEDIEVVPVAGLPPLVVPRAQLNRDGQRLEITLPEAQLTLAPNRRIAVKAGSIVVTDFDKIRPEIEISGRGQATVGALVDVLSSEAIGALQPGQLPAGTDGKVEAHWRVTLPMFKGVTLADGDLDAKARITEGRIPNIVGEHDVTGATLTIGATERTIDVKGDLLLAGILAKVNGQWVLGEKPEKQAPIVIAARLDNADRRRLGMPSDDLVLGEVPVEVQVTPGAGELGRVVVNADFSGAELVLDGISWAKPPGRSARLVFEVVRQKGGKGVDLQGFRLSGDSITVHGTVSLGPDGRITAYRFPGFSLDVVTNLEVEGVRRADKVWDVKARGKTFDGMAIMRSLYAVEPPRPQHHPEEAVDLDARIDTVIGHHDTTVRQLRMQLKRRNRRLVGLELSGVLDGGRPIEARLPPGPQRVMHVETPDAGQALKTIGFYASMAGGDGDLWVNLDGRAGADRTGQIQISRFRILGDPIVSELVEGADETRPAIAVGNQRPTRRTVREEIAFDSLRGSFATGNQQVVIESLNVAGPLVGASVRGKMDFRTRSVSLGGTYVPLSGLNRVFSGIPIVGEILTGPSKDGVIGLTFAVDGPMAKPNVIINPLSMVAPGMLREIFQMVPQNPSVTPAEGGSIPIVRESAYARPPAAGAPRAEPRPRQKRPAAPTPQVLDGWSSETTVPRQR